MTKKHFIMMAIEFGELWREADRYPDRPNFEATIQNAQNRVMSVCKRSNPRFDRDHFDGFVQEIRRYERDLDGKKIKRASVTA